MNTRYWDKSTLYRNIDTLKFLLGLEAYYFPIKSKKLAHECIKNLTIEEIEFPSKGICGILYRGKNSTSMALNAGHTEDMQNFDCMHELIHFHFHDEEDWDCICGDNNGVIKQRSYLEWQANTGAAQFLVPYQDFIPRFCNCLYRDMSATSYLIPTYLSEFYGVTSCVISNRINELNYEIDQYVCGTPIDQINLLSDRRQRELGIRPTQYKLFCAFGIPGRNSLIAI